jgi:hypothetical protein
MSEGPVDSGALRVPADVSHMAAIPASNGTTYSWYRGGTLSTGRTSAMGRMRLLPTSPATDSRRVRFASQAAAPTSTAIHHS